MSRTDKRIAIFGAGAVGSYIGAFIDRAGHDVTLVDPWAAHVDRIQKEGLQVSGPQGEFVQRVRAVHWADAQAFNAPFDVIFLAVKSYDTEWAAHFAKRFLSEDGVMLSSQNCMNDLLVASIVGHEREAPCVISGFAVALWEPGKVVRRREPEGAGHSVFRVGELHGKITPRVEELVELLGSVDGAYATSNIWGERWSKLALNAASNPVVAITGLGAQGLAADPRARLVYIQLAKECVQVGQALDYQIEQVNGIEAEVWSRADQGDAFEELDARLQGRGDPEDWRSSMAQDVLKGRKSEIEQMNGYIVEKGRERNVATPVNEAVVRVMKEIERGETTPDTSQTERVLSAAGL